MIDALTVIGSFVFGLLMGGAVVGAYWGWLIHQEWGRQQLFKTFADRWPEDYQQACWFCRHEKARLEAEFQFDEHLEK